MNLCLNHGAEPFHGRHSQNAQRAQGRDVCATILARTRPPARPPALLAIHSGNRSRPAGNPVLTERPLRQPRARAPRLALNRRACALARCYRRHLGGGLRSQHLPSLNQTGGPEMQCSRNQSQPTKTKRPDLPLTPEPAVQPSPFPIPPTPSEPGPAGASPRGTTAGPCSGPRDPRPYGARASAAVASLMISTICRRRAPWRAGSPEARPSVRLNRR